MTLEKRVEMLEKTVNNLQNSFLQSQINQVPITEKIEDTSVKVGVIDDTMGDFAKLVFPEWSANSVDYFAADKVSYNGKYYRCIQSHKSQVDWTPDTAVSLWVNISDPAEEFPDWKQPSGAHDAYNKGDKVTHLEKHWISDIDANVYEPSVYGWTEV